MRHTKAGPHLAAWTIIRPVVRKFSCLLILAVIVLCPFAANAAADFWTEGMYDPELDAVRHTPLPFDGASDNLPSLGLAHLLVVVTFVPRDDLNAALIHTPPSPRQPRAPPFSQ